jgi:GntR family transcriptional regulator
MGGLKMSQSKMDLFVRIKGNYKTLIEKGAFLEGEFLPSVRKASQDLGVNPNTVQKAYQELAEEGYIEIIPKKGAYVIKNMHHPENKLIDSIKQQLDILKKYYAEDDILIMVKNHLEGDKHD